MTPARTIDELHSLRSAVGTGLLLVNLLGYSVGYYGGRLLRLPEPMTSALTLVIGMQNAGGRSQGAAE